MKNTVKFIIAASLMLLINVNLSADNKKPAKVEEVTFITSMDCEKCVKKINANIAFEKGVKDLKTNLEDKSVYIKYDASKTNKEMLQKAIEKLGYTAVEKSSEEE